MFACGTSSTVGEAQPLQFYINRALSVTDINIHPAVTFSRTTTRSGIASRSWLKIEQNLFPDGVTITVTSLSSTYCRNEPCSCTSQSATGGVPLPFRILRLLASQAAPVDKRKVSLCLILCVESNHIKSNLFADRLKV